ncbi:hypothetical protein [Bacillus clarus]|nr:hypothetical protein [Bacillus clarus]
MNFTLHVRNLSAGIEADRVKPDAIKAMQEVDIDISVSKTIHAS